MPKHIPLQNITLIAGQDLSTKQYYAVKVDTNGQAVLAGAGENSVGVVQNVPASGQTATVMTLGISPVVYGASITAGSNVTPDANGKVVTAGGSDAVLGIALESGNADEVHPILLVTRTSTGVGIASANSILTIPVSLAALDSSEPLTEFVPGFAGTIKKMDFVVQTPTTDSTGKSVNISLEIGTTAVTGGVVTLNTDVSANDPDTMGKVIAGTAITDNNAFSNADSISVVAGAASGAFVDGSGVLLIVLEQ